ncbi:hypothetical protein EJB05_49141 [Eragrostis curvula]|uniref:Uncharacterized protein n=1 Tax=Eragrostis curvula TaxID=38414 RepID=A0A5J9T3K5_9POAL|nr:hypothetical protein EJB05_49141 [Eragrostis curvula]
MTTAPVLDLSSAPDGDEYVNFQDQVFEVTTEQQEEGKGGGLLASSSKPSSKSGRHHRSEEDIDDEEYARRLHVALNKGSRDIPADANIVSIDDSSDDESGGGDSMDMDAPVDPGPAGSPAPVIPPNDGSVLASTGDANPVLDSNMGGTHISSRVSLINSASSGGTENASSDVVGAPSEDADERRN